MPHENFIGGAWKPAATGATDAVLNPATGETIARVPSSDATDADAAVAVAAEAFTGWGATTPRERSEKLLLNILPPAIAERLKRNETNIAQGHADVTVMVADIVGFTRMTEELSPVETVKILNDVFSMFDESADKFHVDKIKTIGDAYMAAAGLDTGAHIHYADAVAGMALEMQQKIREYRERTGERIELRIGIGTGPVVAGIIGSLAYMNRDQSPRVGERPD